MSIQDVLSLGPKLSGWFKTGVVVVGLVVSYTSLVSEVKHNRSDRVTADSMLATEVEKVRQQEQRDLQEINLRLRRIEDLLIDMNRR